jgi:hypothetical protein
MMSPMEEKRMTRIFMLTLTLSPPKRYRAMARESRPARGLTLPAWVSAFIPAGPE